MVENKLPVFMHDKKTNEIFREVVSCIPKKTKIHLVGGAIRNSLYYKYFKKKLPSRDYDVYIGGSPKKFISNLRKKGFVYGKLNRKNERVVKKRKSTGAKELKDFVFIDIHFSAEKNILKSLQKNANFTINGFALPLEKVFSGDWYKSIISVKNAEKDIRNRQISVNAYIHPAQLYACVRFVSHGFKPPTEKEAEGPFHLLKKLRKNQLKRNLRKVFEQTGGKMKARKIAKRMGIKEDIFSLKVIKTL